jgi:hypothetical protein
MKQRFKGFWPECSDDTVAASSAHALAHHNCSFFYQCWLPVILFENANITIMLDHVISQRDMAERGHSLESIKASINARKPDFDAYIDPQKQYADAVIQVLPTQLIPDDNEGKVLRVRMVMKEGVKYFEPVYLFDEGSTIDWIPCGRKLTCSYPGIKFFYGPDTYFGNEV